MTIGDKIRIMRREQKLTQKQLAGKAGVAEISIRNYENGKRQPKIEQMRKIAFALGLSINSFISTQGSSPLLAFLNFLETIGYKISLYEEETWRSLSLCELKTSKRFTITDGELRELLRSVSAFTVFQTGELVERVENARELEYRADAAKEDSEYWATKEESSDDA